MYSSKWLPSDLLSSTQLNASTKFRLKIQFHHSKNNPLHILEQTLQEFQSTSQALHNGVKEQYQNFDPSTRGKPEEFLPVVRDPTLVRAVQLAVLKLQDIADTEQVIKQYHGIERRFQELLKSRLSQVKSAQNLAHEQ